MNIIYILGTDGAGKTTAARRLAELTFGGHRARYIYCQHRPLVLWLMKLPARLLFMRRADQFRNYEEYKARKDAASSRRPWLTRLYTRLCYFDGWLQTWPKMLWARCTTSTVVLDRYYLDWVVNLGELQGNGLDGMLRDAAWLERVLPKARVHLFLDVSEVTAFNRKDDIQSVQYLRERKRRYLQLAPHYGFQIVDANQSAETVFQQLRRLVDAAVTPPPALEATPVAR
jgi:thymidylate kinase